MELCVSGGSMIDRHGLQVASELVDFIQQRALPGPGIAADAFWAGTADIFAQLAPQNAKLLEKRDLLQAEIDGWHAQRAGSAIDQMEYRAFLRSIGYLADEPAPFQITTENVDPEIATTAGP